MIFTSAKKIQELQDQLKASTAEAEKLKANLAAAQAELKAVNKVMDDDDEDKVEDEDEEEVKGDEHEDKPSADDEEEKEAEDEDEEKAEDEDEEEEKVKASAKVSALVRKHNALSAKVAKLESSITARVSSVLSKMGIDPIHASKGTNDGTRDKPATSGKKGIARAAELLNEKAKAKR